MGEATDTAILDKSSLTARKRSVKQGPVAIHMDFVGGKVTGSLNMNGLEKPISTDLGGPVFADGPGSSYSIACLPLADGYTAIFRNFDVQRQKPKTMQLKVAGSESVTVPAGTFDAHKVEITNAEGGAEKVTLWVAKDSRKPVKFSAVLPQMGGATMTAELQ